MKLQQPAEEDSHDLKALHIEARDAVAQDSAVERTMTGALVARETCGPGDNTGFCQKPTDSTTTGTLPIVLGAVIPICCAIVVFYFLHRRHKKKQALEDANDPHKSLDFGLDMAATPHTNGKRKRGKKGPPEMITTDMGYDPARPGRPPRGLSLDMLGSPYMLPGGLDGSRDSFQSMSRSMHDEHDPYRQVTMMRSSTDTARSPNPFSENASVYSMSTVQTAPYDRMDANAQRIPKSLAKLENPMLRINSNESGESQKQTYSATSTALPSRKSSFATPHSSLPNIHEDKSTPPPLPNHPSIQIDEVAFPFPPEPAADPVRPPRTASLALPARKSSAVAGAPFIDRPISDSSFYGDELPPPPAPPKDVTPDEDTTGYDVDPSTMYNGRFSIDTGAPSQQYPVQNNRISMMGLRPLPPDQPAESAEQRANRIRSFYKEYFDDSRPHPANAYYEEDYDLGYYENAPIYDPSTGEFFYPNAPYAQPMGRRAMTPPPRGAGGPRFAGAEHGRHYSTASAGPGPFRGRAAQRGPPKKKLPPPKVLTSLPTPHLLKDDTALIMNPIDFAPPTSFREHQNGRRADSPLGTQRPFSPSVKVYSPLVSSFENLSAVPSPHLLRKSGTFTSLDFSPQPRFRGQEGSRPGSDAGSIRSARSGISAVQMDAVRAGAYRVSRIPKEMVTTKEDIRSQLRPQMNLTSPA